jgi:hypothetical protein
MGKTVWGHLRALGDRFGARVAISDSSSRWHRPATSDRTRDVAQMCELLIDHPTLEGDSLRWSAKLLRPSKTPEEIWFKLPKIYSRFVTKRADPFIVATLFAAAESAPVLRVKGASISHTLLRNLTEFQYVWRAWRGFKLTKIEAEIEPDGASAVGPAIAAFSGGIDSSFTVYRHSKALSRELQNLTTAMMVHGFDIPLHDDVGFNGAAERARRMLASLGVSLITMKTNARDFCADWEMTHGAAVAAALTLLSREFSVGLIASSGTYHLPLIPWGSNPLTDPMLGSREFTIVHDGANSSRLDKVRALGDWPGALKDLRFCWQNKPPDANCGHCLKCILTALEFKCIGIEPECFITPITDSTIVEGLSRYISDPHGDICFREVLDTALVQRMAEPWLPALHDAIQRLRPAIQETISSNV